ncbi:MAG: Kynurenine formamidase [Methanomethylovorans sp. PtaU1.Bin093]|uniref:cyclase family protein n=1 Tax=Methanomethylovorans sp. PtaU1.Bin093 TaxID=1811679 RepID=UPI0009D1758B|nr:cyclase family protein [Methanomethylovorans sp. PtaU1.Bin093]OPY22208.1 MAG: Kynurenine formamidase [Methanomethylovorans sp. PtaU1.Bin093]
MIFEGKRVIDITIAIRQGMPVYPGDPEPVIERICSIGKEGFTLSTIFMGSHTGTHVDAPSHVLENGISVDMLCPGSLIGRAILLDVRCMGSHICAGHLDTAWKAIGPENKIDALLLKTGASSIEETGNLFLKEDVASWMSTKEIKILGVDAFSIENEVGLPLHRSLLSQGVNIVECLDLGKVEEGIYTFICLPLKIIDCDAAPARAILIENQL